MFRQLPWTRWLGEFTIIVIGVLCAFAIENYREFRGDRDRESAYLQNLLTDLNEDKSRLEVSLTRSERALGQLESILLLAGVDINKFVVSPGVIAEGYDRAKLKDTNFDSWYAGAFFSFLPSRATYSTLLSTGDLLTIQDDQLRSALTFYYEEVDVRNRDNEFFMQTVLALNEFLIENGIDVHTRDNLDNIARIENIVPIVSNAREYQHWWYSRKINMRDSLLQFSSELERVMDRSN